MITMESKKMENLYRIYLNTFEVFKKSASKKDKNYKELREALSFLKETAMDFVNPENLKKYSAVLILALETSTVKIIEKSLISIDQIISHELIDPGTFNEIVKNMLGHLYAKSMLNDDNINYKILNLCIIVYSNKLININGANLINIIKVCLNIFLSSKNPNCQNMAKLTLIQIVDHLFARLDNIFNPQSSNKYLGTLSHKTLMKSPMTDKSELVDESNLTNVNTTHFWSSRAMGMGNEYNLLISKYLNFYIDMIEVNNFSSKGNEDLTSFVEENLQKTLDDLKLDQSEIKNESGHKPGKYGWCILCRTPSNFFSDKINFPICGNECEVEMLKLGKLIDIDLYGDSSNYRDDYINLLKILSKLSTKEPKQQNYIEQINLKLREFCLELIHTLLQKGSKYFYNDMKLIQVIKDSTIDSLIKNTLSNEMNIFKLSISLFLTIIFNFRDHLKDEIEVFINKVLIVILESEHLGFIYKEVILDAMMRLAENCNFLVEIYVNYDCDITHKSVFKELVNLMTKIINGMYKKPKYANTFKPLQEANLRIKCLDFLTRMIRNLELLIASSNNKLNINDASQYEAYGPDDDLNSTTTMENIGMELKDKITQNLKLKAIQSKAIDKFNINPNSCLKFLIAHDLLPSEQAFNSTKANLLRQDTDKVKPRDDKNKDKEVDSISTVEQMKDCNIYQNSIFLFSINSTENLMSLLKSFDMEQVALLTYDDFIAREMAKFIRSNLKELNKTTVGNYLCGAKRQNQNALVHFIDSFNFKNFHILEALRVLFAELPIVGEAQIIDRVIQNFGEKYHKENPNAFKNPDLSYYISMSIMMLNTDLHREEVEKKMQLNIYIKRVKELCQSEIVDEDYLTDIYNRVLNDPLLIPGQKIANNKNKKELIKMEKESIMKSTFEELQNKNYTSKNYIIHIDHDDIKHLIEASWSNFLGIFSQLLADFEEETIVNTCIDNILTMARMCGFLRLDTISEAFLNTILNMTNIMEGREIKLKNIDCTKALIDFAMHGGSYVKSSWFNILTIISKIEYYHTIAGQFKTEAELFAKEIRRKSKLKNPDREIEIELKNTEIVCKYISNIYCDNVFSKTATFDEEGILAFLVALCKVSKNELDQFFNPRNYSLHKLVEVADFNIFRIQIEWAKIWKIISDHLVYVVTHYGLDNICNDAIDSLRQTVIKLLQKPDLTVYNFQMDFFRPFEVILNESVNRPLRCELIMTCISYIVQNSKSIHSGWIIIFNILKAGLRRKDAKLNTEIVKILQTISEDFSILNNINQEVFRGYIECLCHVYLEDNLKRFAFETILKLMSKIITNIHSLNNFVSSNIQTNEKKFEFLKIFFHGFDDLLRINAIEHLNLLFEIISHNKELIFSTDTNSFIYSYFCFFKPHLVTLLLHYFTYRLNQFDFDQINEEDNAIRNSFSTFNEFHRRTTIDDIYYNSKIYLESSLLKMIEILEEAEKKDENDKLSESYFFELNKNGGMESRHTTINFLKSINKCYDRDSDLIIKKLETLKGFELKNYEIALEFFLEKFHAMVNKISDCHMNYKFFYEDLLVTLLNLSMFNRNSDVIFKILGRNLLSIGNELSGECWKMISSQIYFILVSLSHMKRNPTEECLIDTVQFTSTFGAFYMNVMINYFPNIAMNSQLVEEYKLLNRIFIKLLIIDIENDYSEYKLISSTITLDVLKTFSKIKLLILEKSKEIKDYYDVSCTDSLYYLHRVFIKYNLSLEENHELINILEFELESLLPKFLNFLNEEELQGIFDSLMDLMDSKNTQLRYAAKYVIKQFRCNNHLSFNKLNK